KRDHSKTPIGPFQNTVCALAISPANSSRDSGPMSSPSQPGGGSSYGTTRLSASASNDDAATTSRGSTTSNVNGLDSRTSSAILPPISTRSAREPRFWRTPTLSSTFAPPETITNGGSTPPSRRPRCSSSASSSSPAYAGSRCATASVEACARCAEPKASSTYRSQPSASSRAKP